MSHQRSAIYTGEIQHRRLSPKQNIFSYGVCYFFLELGEIPKLFNIPLLFSYNRPAILSFWDKDYLTRDNISELIYKETNNHQTGPVLLLTNISYFGFCFNPVSFYYCYAADGITLEHIVSVITNTPWGEKHIQVFSFSKRELNIFKFVKNFHVSPFMPMEIDYSWLFGRPDQNISVYMQNKKKGEQELIFDSTLKLERRDLSHKNIVASFLLFPFVTFKTMMAIYFQALKLFIKRVPFYSHPSKEKVYDNSSIT